MGVVEILLLLIAAIFVFQMWWIPRSMKIDQAKTAIAAAKQKINLLEIELENAQNDAKANEIRQKIQFLMDRIGQLEAEL